MHEDAQLYNHQVLLSTEGLLPKEFFLQDMHDRRPNQAYQNAELPGVFIFPENLEIWYVNDKLAYKMAEPAGIGNMSMVIPECSDQYCSLDHLWLMSQKAMSRFKNRRRDNPKPADVRLLLKMAGEHSKILNPDAPAETEEKLLSEPLRSCSRKPPEVEYGFVKEQQTPKPAKQEA